MGKRHQRFRIRRKIGDFRTISGETILTIVPGARVLMVVPVDAAGGRAAD